MIRRRLIAPAHLDLTAAQRAAVEDSRSHRKAARAALLDALDHMTPEEAVEVMTARLLSLHGADATHAALQRAERAAWAEIEA